MIFFPLFIDLEDKEVLVVGGGDVASRKIKHLLAFKPHITVISPTCTTFIEDLYEQKKVTLIKRKFNFLDIEGKDLVIVAIDNISLQRDIFKICKNKSIPINCVDNLSYCTFIFPSLIVNGELVIGISTSGKAPAVSKQVRKTIEKNLPENINNVVEDVYLIRKTLEKGKLRQNIIKRVVDSKSYKE